METGTNEGHKHHVRDMAIFDCGLCPSCNALYFTGGEDPPERCARCDEELGDVRLDCEPTMQRMPFSDEG
ncbi:MAG: hypothetical protein SV186_02295 [Candidatus Nanohaloarchaea archaeon]|nr:hypothetical protein [Candidatus Nanohaloarchaea archaeon]